jgi:1-acyl-sn-glycerol-3-phosphate acyltransferase
LDLQQLFLRQREPAFSAPQIDAWADQAVAFEVPRDEFKRLHEFINFYFPSTLVGVSNIPAEPTLFVGNHSLYGIDAIILVSEVFHHTDRCLRVTADRFFFQLGLGDFLLGRGVVLASPATCGALMEAGEDVVVYPGGAFESTKPEAQKYSLHWRERYGFVRMAARYGYSITPFGMIGPDDCYEHLLEGEELLETKPGKLLARLGLTDKLRKDLLPPVSRGVLGTPLPKPQPAFAAFGNPIAVPRFDSGEVPDDILRSVRQETAQRIDDLLRDMLLLRAQNQPSWLRRWFL